MMQEVQHIMMTKWLFFQNNLSNKGLIDYDNMVDLFFIHGYFSVYIFNNQICN